MSPATRIKICGLTRPRDARMADELGADYLGVIFAGSPRRVDVGAARAIRDAVPDARLVGVFADADAEEIVRIASSVGLDLVQLHGVETPENVRETALRTHRPVIKAFAGGELPRADLLATYDRAGFFLFDLDKPAAGSSATRAPESVVGFPRERFRRTRDAVSRSRRKGFRMFLAGALDPSNIRDAVEETGAYGVDVCRGVESRPGIKDARKLERFIREVRG